MEINSEQKTKRVVSAKARILAVASVVITLFAWPSIPSCIKNTYALYICWIIWLGACLCGMMSLKSIKKIKGFLWTRLLAWIGCILSIYCILGITFMVGNWNTRSRFTCWDNLRVMGRSIRTYCEKHDGKFPDTSRWCDLLLSEPKVEYDSEFEQGLWELSEGKFKCPTVAEGRSGYAFNKNLAGKRISEVDPNTVVLFETTTGGWNLSGGPELMHVSRHEAIIGKSGSYVLYLGKDKPVVEFVYRSQINKLRWDP
jgi:hypothetical protein